nr:CDP-alcohol phosphatidyltransferase family protein [Bacteroidaceae bacterium]
MKKHIPNIITCCNLICGCTAVSAAFMLPLPINYFLAIVFILSGAVFDFFDGMAARALGVSSPMGLELDSLADVITFGVAPSAMLFRLFTEVQYPEFMEPLRGIMPYTAFITAAFSALRLAKFNLDKRQTTSFIGLPTPANALFWGSLIVGQHAFLVSGKFNALFLFLFMMLFCFLLVAELPLFALKFKNLSWADNKIKYIFLLGCLPCFLLAESCFAGIILWYVTLSI